MSIEGHDVPEFHCYFPFYRKCFAYRYKYSNNVDFVEDDIPENSEGTIIEGITDCTKKNSLSNLNHKIFESKERNPKEKEIFFNGSVTTSLYEKYLEKKTL